MGAGGPRRRRREGDGKQQIPPQAVSACHDGQDLFSICSVPNIPRLGPRTDGCSARLLPLWLPYICVLSVRIDACITRTGMASRARGVFFLITLCGLLVDLPDCTSHRHQHTGSRQTRASSRSPPAALIKSSITCCMRSLHLRAGISHSVINASQTRRPWRSTDVRIVESPTPGCANVEKDI